MLQEGESRALWEGAEGSRIYGERQAGVDRVPKDGQWQTDHREGPKT